ncbi:MAG: hypothetical protein HYU66_14200 [Armatimonadetes bacterium]|nr:hypothetical protein [Armatimonadota bacterium]
MQRVVRQGWSPILAFSLHGGVQGLPRWFSGEPSDAGGKVWFKSNLDGTPAEEGRSDQFAALTVIAHDLAARLAELGLTGLHWETAYELGHDMPLPAIHYHVAKGVRQGDPAAKLMGPATWPGWTVEERFVKPCLKTYGADLLDFVSVHWYADNEHGLWAAPGWHERTGPLTVADRAYLPYLMETTPKFEAWCTSLRRLLDDPALNPAGKRIGIAFTEYDALAASPYGHNPENPDWPHYRADADCYLNANAFGAVWRASALCHLAASGCLDIACLFTTRSYYGVIENAPEHGYHRQPAWFAWRLLRETAGLKPGAPLLATTVDGPRDSAAAHVQGTDTPWLEAFAVDGAAGLRLSLINRCLEGQRATVAVGGLPADRPVGAVRRYELSQGRVARFIGRRPGSAAEGAFEGAPDDSASARCLEPLPGPLAARDGDVVSLEPVDCPPLSLTILALDAAGWRVTRGAPARMQPAPSAAGYQLRYGLGLLFQVAPGRAGLLCNRRTVGAGHWDFEDGTDLVLFDRLEDLGAAEPLVLSLNETSRDPATGRLSCAVKYPVVGGFVPAGATLPDGTPHPHAGTGFGVTEVLSYPLNDAGTFRWDDPHADYVELLQLGYDGRRVRLVGRDRRDAERPLRLGREGWVLTVPGLSMAIPDGEELLFPCSAKSPPRTLTGVSRWRRVAGEWQPVSFVPVTGGTEPSLVREGDGALLFLARGYGESAEEIRVWRSTDGQAWTSVLQAEHARAEAPVVLNQAADGTPYVSGNLLGRGRSVLCLWPLNAARTALGPPVVARDCAAELGPPPERASWFADHPTAATVGLADGRLHHLLCYRVMAFRLDNTGEAVTEHTGCCVEELVTGADR